MPSPIRGTEDRLNPRTDTVIAGEQMELPPQNLKYGIIHDVAAQIPTPGPQINPYKQRFDSDGAYQIPGAWLPFRYNEGLWSNQENPIRMVHSIQDQEGIKQGSGLLRYRGRTGQWGWDRGAQRSSPMTRIQAIPITAPDTTARFSDGTTQNVYGVESRYQRGR